MGLLKRLVAWWRGDADPADIAVAKQEREDIETRRVGGLSGQANISHRGSDSTGRGGFE